MRQLTKMEAVAIAESGEWREWPDRELVGFQLFQDRLCMDFSYFHEKLEQVLGRPVFTHEMGLNRDGLIAEYLGEKKPPTLQEIMDMLPKGKVIGIIRDAPEEEE